MLCPITGAESYVCDTGKSMKAVGLAVAQEDSVAKSRLRLLPLGFEYGLIPTVKKTLE